MSRGPEEDFLMSELTTVITLTRLRQRQQFKRWRRQTEVDIVQNFNEYVDGEDGEGDGDLNHGLEY